MCCTVLVEPIPRGLTDFTDSEWFLVLSLAGFVPDPDARTSGIDFIRKYADGRNIKACYSGQTVRFNINPIIGEDHTYQDHVDTRDIAALMFRTAAALGERYNAKVVQHALRGECKEYHNSLKLELADYPEHPLYSFENICYNFRRALMHGIEEPNHEAHA